MRLLFKDFMAQSWFMKGIIAWGWLCVLIMIASLADHLRIIVGG